MFHYYTDFVTDLDINLLQIKIYCYKVIYTLLTKMQIFSHFPFSSWSICCTQKFSKEKVEHLKDVQILW